MIRIKVEKVIETVTGKDVVAGSFENVVRKSDEEEIRIVKELLETMIKNI